MALDTPAINTKLNTLYPSNIDIGHVLLLSNVLVSNLDATVEHMMNTLETVATTFETGSRVRLAIGSGDVYPTVVSGDQIDSLATYFLIKDSPTIYRVARTLQDAIDDIEINFSDNGSPSLKINELELDKTDPLIVSIKKELTHVDYQRKILNVPPANGGFKNFNYVLIVDDASVSLVYRHKLVLLGSTNVIGNTTGDKDHFLTETTPKTYLAGQTALLGIRFSLSSL